MSSFISNKIQLNEEIIGEQLKEKRLLKKLELSDISYKLNINVEYLKLIENGEFNKLPVGVYGKNFLKEYMYFLGIDSEEALEFLDELNEKNSSSHDKLFVKKVTKSHQFLIIPKIIRYVLIILGVLICIFYLAYYIKNIITAPSLIIESIPVDTVVYENYVDVVGQTDIQAEVSINDDVILIDTTGGFSKRVNLKNGLNVITIVAQKKYSKKNIIVRKVIVQNEN